VGTIGVSGVGVCACRGAMAESDATMVNVADNTRLNDLNGREEKVVFIILIIHNLRRRVWWKGYNKSSSENEIIFERAALPDDCCLSQRRLKRTCNQSIPMVFQIHEPDGIEWSGIANRTPGLYSMRPARNL